MSSHWAIKLSVSVLSMPNISYSPKVSWTVCYARVWVHQCSERAGGTSVRKVPVFVLRSEEAGEKRWYLFAFPLFCISFCHTKPQSLCLCWQDRWGRWGRKNLASAPLPRRAHSSSSGGADGCLCPETFISPSSEGWWSCWDAIPHCVPGKASLCLWGCSTADPYGAWKDAL